MGDFSQFYSGGGFFMHLITVTIGAAVASFVMAWRGHAQGGKLTPLVDLADRLAWLCLAEGLLGALFGWFDMCLALRTLPPEVDPVIAALRGAGLVPIPIAWALMVAIPLWTATGVLRVRAAAAATSAT